MSKSLVRNAQSVLKELGHDISIGHCHELFSRLQGYSSHNHNREKTPFVMPKEELVILAIDTENNAEEWWDEGGRELWQKYSPEMEDSIELPKSKANIFLDQAKKIKGWNKGPKYAPYPIVIVEHFPSHKEKTPFVRSKEGEFSVKIVSEVVDYRDGIFPQSIEVKRYINVKALSQEEAEMIISEKLKDEDYVEELRDDLESWEVIWLCAPMVVQNFKNEIYSRIEEPTEGDDMPTKIMPINEVNNIVCEILTENKDKDQWETGRQPPYMGWYQIFGNHEDAKGVLNSIGGETFDEFKKNAIEWSKEMYGDEHDEDNAKRAAKEVWQDAKGE